MVIPEPEAFHDYTVSFLAYLIWDPVHMYNAVTNGWTDFEHQITFDVRQPKTRAFTMERLRKFIADYPYVDVIRYCVKTVAVLNSWGKARSWGCHMVHHALYQKQNYSCAGAVDFGEGKKSIYALHGAQVLVQRDKEVQMAVNEYGAGRGVYISGLPYSFENSRLLHRAVLWSTHSEEEMERWLSANCNVDVHAYVDSGKFCVVNNTYELQSTTVYRGDGSSFPLRLAANEIRWFEI